MCNHNIKNIHTHPISIAPSNFIKITTVLSTNYNPNTIPFLRSK